MSQKKNDKQKKAPSFEGALTLGWLANVL